MGAERRSGTIEEGGEGEGAGGEVTAGGADMWCMRGVCSGVGPRLCLCSSTSWPSVSGPDSETGREVGKGFLELP